MSWRLQTIKMLNLATLVARVNLSKFNRTKTDLQILQPKTLLKFVLKTQKLNLLLKKAATKCN